MVRAAIKASASHRNYQRIALAIDYLSAHQREQPSLGELASFIGLSETHLQRVFSEWAGVSPKQFLSYVTVAHAKELLKSESVLEAALGCGLSGAGRLHDLMVRCESVTPGEFKARGEGLQIYFSSYSCQLGFCFIAVTKRGICKLSFYDAPDEYDAQEAELRALWPNAQISLSQRETEKHFSAIFDGSGQHKKEVSVLLSGTPFRLQVWEALLKIPAGSVASYGQIAKAIGRPTGARAVANAIASNEVAFLIPCHRVIRESGAISGYRWGQSRKAALLSFERCAREKGSI